NVVVPAVVYVAAEIAAPGVVRHNGRGDLVIGSPEPRHVSDALIADLAAYLAGAGIPTRISHNIDRELWWKLTLNCAHNAVSALGRSRYGPMMAMPQVRHVMSDAVREIIALAKAKAVRVAMPDPVEAVLRFADSMPQAISSTAQDLERGRPTAIDYLNGYVVRDGDAPGLPAPVHPTPHALVRLLEEAPRCPPGLAGKDKGGGEPPGSSLRPTPSPTLPRQRGGKKTRTPLPHRLIAKHFAAAHICEQCPHGWDLRRRDREQIVRQHSEIRELARLDRTLDASLAGDLGVVDGDHAQQVLP